MPKPKLAPVPGSPASGTKLVGYKVTQGDSSYTLTPDAIDWIKERSQRDYQGLYTSSTEDISRKQQGLLPASVERSYGSSQSDKMLRELGLPPTSQFNEYAAKYFDWYGSGSTYHFTKEQKGYLSEQFKKTWTYDGTAEDMRRQSLGLMPSAVEALYSDTYADSVLAKDGLPPSAKIGDYITSYNERVGKQLRIDQFNVAVAAKCYDLSLAGIGNDSKTYTKTDAEGNPVLDATGIPITYTGSKAWVDAYYDLLESPEWADVAALYKKSPGAVEYGNYTSDVAYREARLKASMEATDDDSPYTSYDSFLATYPEVQKVISQTKIVDDAIVAAKGADYTYGDQLVDAEKERKQARYSLITDRPTARAYAQEVANSDPNYDPITVLQDMFDSGVDEKHVRQAKNWFKGHATTQEEKKAIEDYYDSLTATETESAKSEYGIFSKEYADAVKSDTVAAMTAQAETNTKKKEERKENAWALGVYDEAVKTLETKPFQNNPQEQEKAAGIFRSYLVYEGSVVDADSLVIAKKALSDAGYNNTEIEMIASEYTTPDASKSKTGIERFMDIFGSAASADNPAAIGFTEMTEAVQSINAAPTTPLAKAQDADKKAIIDQIRARGIMTDFQLDQAVRQRGDGRLLDPTESAYHHYMEVKAPNSGLTPEQAQAEWDKMVADGGLDAYVATFMSDSMTDSTIAKTDAEVLAYQGVYSMIPKMIAGLAGDAVALADMTASWFTGRSEQWDFTKEVLDFTNDIRNYGRTDQSLFTQGVSTVSDMGAELGRMYLMSAAGAGLWGNGGGLAAKAAADSATKGMMLLAKSAASIVKSVPFVLDAMGSYYAEAVQSGATVQQARVYAIVCGTMEGAAESLMTSEIWGRVLGSKSVVQQVVEGNKKTLTGALVGKAKFINLASSFLGEYTEEAGSYALSWGMSTKQGWNKSAFSWEEFNKQGIYGGILGLFGSAISLPNITEANIISEYMLKSKEYGTAKYDLLFSALLSSTQSETTRAGYLARGYTALMSTADYASTVQGLEASIGTMEHNQTAYENALAQAKAELDDRLTPAIKAEELVALMDKEGIDKGDPRYVSAVAASTKAGSSEKIKAKYKGKIDTIENGHKADVNNMTIAIEKARDQIAAHHAALTDVFADEIAAMYTAVSADMVQQAAFAQYLKSEQGIDITFEDGMTASEVADAYDAAIKQRGASYAASEAAGRAFKAANVTFFDEKMDAIRSGSAEEYIESHTEAGAKSKSKLVSKTAAKKAAEKANSPEPAPTNEAEAEQTASEEIPAPKRVPLTQKEMDSITSLGSVLSRTVTFENLKPKVDGLFTDGRIVLNKNQRPLSGSAYRTALNMTFIHEMTHSIEGTIAYGEFSDFMVKRAEAKYKKTRDELYEIFARAYEDMSEGEVDLSSDSDGSFSYDKARRELVARIASEELFTDFDTINALVRERSGVAGRFLNWIHFTLAKMKAKFSRNSAETIALLEAERLYTKAFAASGKSAADGIREMGRSAVRQTIIQRGVAENQDGGASEAELAIARINDNEETGMHTIRYFDDEVPYLDKAVEVADSLIVELKNYIKQTYPDAFFDTELFEDTVRGAAIRTVQGDPDYLNGNYRNGQSRIYTDVYGAVSLAKTAYLPKVHGLADAAGDDVAKLYSRLRNTAFRIGIISPDGTRNIGLDGDLSAKALFRYFPKRTYKKKGASIEAVYEETSTQYPGLIKPGATNPSEMMREFIDFMQNARDERLDSINAIDSGELAHDLAMYAEQKIFGELFEAYTAVAELRANPQAAQTANPAEPMAQPANVVMFDQPQTENGMPPLHALSDESITTTESLIRKYGAFDAGMQPRERNVAVERKISPTEHVSQFMRSAAESSHITEEQLPYILDMVANGEMGTYFRVGNKETMAKAQTIIAEKGGGRAAEQYFSGEVRMGRIFLKDAATMEAVGIQLLADAAKRGDNVSVHELLADMAIISPQTGRANQALSMLKKTGGVGQAFYIQKIIEKLNADNADLIAKGRAELIVADPALIEALASARTPAAERAALEAIYKDIGSKTPLTPGMALKNWRYFSMLSSPVTWVRNLTGNMLGTAMRRSKNLVKWGVESAAVKSGFMKQSERTAMPYLAWKHKEVVAYAQTMWDKYRDDVEAGGKYGFEEEIRKYAKKSNIKPVNSAMNVVDFILNEFGDITLFLHPTFVDTFTQAMLARGLTPETMTAKQERQIANYSMKEAQRATLRDGSEFASLLAQLSHPQYKSKFWAFVQRTVVEGLVPFKKVPANVVKRAVEYSPVGLMIGIANASFNVKKGNITAEEAIDQISSGIVGTGLMALGYIVRAFGWVRGKGDDDENYEKLLEATGDQKYSLTIGGVSIGLANLAPATIPFFMGVALYEAFDGGIELSELSSIITNMVDPIMEMSFMGSLNEALTSYRGDDSPGGTIGKIVGTAFQSYASQYVPTVLGAAAKSTGKYLYSAIGDATSPLGAGIDSWARSQVKKVPGLANATLEPVVTLRGEELERASLMDGDAFGEWALDFANTFILPAKVKVIERDAIDREIIRVFEATNETDIIPTLPSNKYLTFQGEDYPMNAEQFTQYSEERGEAVYTALRAAMSGSGYSSAGFDQRKEILKSAINRAETSVSDRWKLLLSDAKKRTE